MILGCRKKRRTKKKGKTENAGTEHRLARPPAATGRRRPSARCHVATTTGSPASIPVGWNLLTFPDRIFPHAPYHKPAGHLNLICVAQFIIQFSGNADALLPLFPRLFQDCATICDARPLLRYGVAADKDSLPLRKRIDLDVRREYWQTFPVARSLRLRSRMVRGVLASCCCWCYV